ncbi:STAS domain-containing protein [Anabaena cylindrica FACHB-243]|uniref:Anti-sigma factor antagonist n=3 Tax=Nostocaceae TaxID=1162 RepID=K9ZJZ1_ANACC|nr:anti-sigma-factor antagonist [Anabaena cylindrica PCC 7122]MBD2419990.1 STAS domain-containing protein [Anabaena cylindrica FACHB-243]MBY5310392.1 STAS domain-containing protein [Anabaena sp. CCAP 1446/1C]BAY04347.1 anti-sigma factor antagonist [Anabaena cylindrica PCC 7122]
MDSQVKMIQPQGIFNSKNGQQLLEEVDQLTSDIKTILIDFQDVTFMDSSGFSALLVTLKTVRQKNVRLVICSINEQIKMIFDMTNTNQVFEVLPDQASFI